MRARDRRKVHDTEPLAPAPAARTWRFPEMGAFSDGTWLELQTIRPPYADAGDPNAKPVRVYACRRPDRRTWLADVRSLAYASGPYGAYTMDAGLPLNLGPWIEFLARAEREVDRG